MTEQELRLELSKMQTQQQQWHDEYTQRDKHWFWQKGFWLFIAGVAMTTLFFKLN